MEMTFNDYINNPMGKKNSVFGSRELYREMYRKKLDAILLREVGKVKYKLYKTKDKNMYIIHFKIPSEPLKNFYYDTVIQFYSKDHGVQISNNLKKYYVKFYSNDPSFVFTFAHSFKQNNLFKKVPVSIISGAEEKETIDRAFTYDIVDLLAKPFNERDIKSVIEKTINYKDM